MAGKKRAASIAAGTGLGGAVLNMTLLASIVTATEANAFVFVSSADNAAFLAHVPPLVEVNTTVVDAEGKIGTRATPDGVAYIKNSGASAGAVTGAAGTAILGNIGDPPAKLAEKPKFNIVIVADVPTVKRGGGNVGTSTYPFDDLPTPVAGQGCPSFFVTATADRPDPAKKLASTVSSATRRYSVLNTAQPEKTVKQKRIVKDAAGNDLTDADGDFVYATDAAGNFIRDNVTVPNMTVVRKFVIRAVKDGAAWGHPGVSGAAIYRTQ